MQTRLELSFFYHESYRTSKLSRWTSLSVDFKISAPHHAWQMLCSRRFSGSYGATNIVEPRDGEGMGRVAQRLIRPGRLTMQWLGEVWR